MQFSFRFNAPTYCCLTSLPDKRKSSDYLIDQNDSNDFWFMHPHIPEDTQINQRAFSETAIQQVPVIRKSLLSQAAQIHEKKQQKDQQQRQEKHEESLVLFEEKSKQKIIMSQQLNIIPKAVKQEQVLEKRIRGNQKIIQNDDKNKIKTKIQKVSAPKISQSVFQKNRSFSMGMFNRPNHSVDKTNKKDIRPCPYPPRIERQWNAKFHKNWYHLSPQSKVIAESEMSVIYEQRMKKSKQQNSKIINVKKQSKKFKF